MNINYESNKAWQQRTRKPLNRTDTLKRTGFKKQGKPIKQGGTLKRSGVLAKVSAKQAIKNREYSKKKKAHLLANPLCARCGLPATDCHHSGGRVGERLTDETLFISMCRLCHDWVENNWNAAVAEGFMISKHQVRK